MKRMLLLILITTCSFIQYAFGGITVSVNYDVAGNATNAYSAYRWRADNGSLVAPSTGASWISNANSPTITSTISVGKTIRLRLGTIIEASAKVNVYDKSGYPTTNPNTYDAYITGITIASVKNAKLMYKESTSSTWITVPSASTAASSGIQYPFAQSPSSVVANGTIIGTATNEALLTYVNPYNLSTWNGNSTNGYNNQYQSLGGSYYDSYDNATATSISTVKMGRSVPATFSYGNFDSYNSINGTNPSSSTGTVTYSSYPTSSGSNNGYQKVDFPFEAEFAIAPTYYAIKGKTYDCQISFDVTYSGNGYIKYNPDYYTTTYSYILNPPLIMSASFPQTSKTFNATGSITIPNTILPVTWRPFNVVKVGNTADLQWGTASEINNKGFEVQRSADGKNFIKIGYVATQAPNGNSSSPLDYTFPDPNPLPGTSYYRLMQIDIDGTRTPSDTKPFSLSGGTSSVAVTPNPVVSDFNLRNAKIGSSYRIVSVSGQVLKSGVVSSATQSISIPYFPAGMYIIQTQDAASAQSISVKFMKQ